MDATAQMPVPIGLEPYEYLTLDIETADASPDDMDLHLRLTWSPSKTWKDETIGKRWREIQEKKREQLALMDESPVICVSLKSESELRLVHCMQDAPPENVQGGTVQGYGTCRQMLIALRTLMDLRVSPDTVLAGHNIAKFDLPKLRWHFMREGLTMPACLQVKGHPIFDTMLEYSRRFSLSNDLYVKLDELLQKFRIRSHKGVISGAMVPGLLAEGDYETIVNYALLDALAEEQLFLRMNGALPDTEPLEITAEPEQDAAPGRELSNAELDELIDNAEADMVEVSQPAEPEPAEQPQPEPVGLPDIDF